MGFDDDLIELIGEEGVRLGLLVAAPPKCQQDLYGFIIYKFWGPPLKTMSISRVAVPARYRLQGFGRQLVRWAIEKAKRKPRHECTRVSLKATPDAVRFYQRLNFTQVLDDDPLSGEASSNEPNSSWMEYNYGASARS